MEKMVQPDKQKVINELNRFVRGRYMGLHQYEQLILHAKDPQVKEMLQRFQKHAKLGTIKVVNRIKELGGEPVDDGLSLDAPLDPSLSCELLIDAFPDITDYLRPIMINLGEQRGGTFLVLLFRNLRRCSCGTSNDIAKSDASSFPSNTAKKPLLPPYISTNSAVRIPFVSFQ